MSYLDNKVIERLDPDAPDLRIVVNELGAAQADIGVYSDRIASARNWWQCHWGDDQWDLGDGCQWGPNAWPWPGASDSRLRIVDTIVKEHVTLDLVAFWTAKVQAKSIRPFLYGRDVNVAQKMLEWRVYTHMKRELMIELELAYTWKHALGLSFSSIEWEQERQIIEIPVTLNDIAQAGQRLGADDIMGKLLDPDKEHDAELVKELQKFSQVLPSDEAREIIKSLRATGTAVLPTVSLRINKPVVMCKRPCVDVLFPSETSDIQKTRWVDIRELVSEAELEDRIVTEGYDPDFVEEALKHKGIFASWMPYTWHDAYAPYTTALGTALGSDRDMVELHHFIYQALHNGVPCKYRLIFNEAAIGTQNLYAVHKKFEYDHQFYPLVAHRRRYQFRPLLSSIGIAEESYTDELDMKRMQDGLNNHADVVIQPPMVAPTLRAKAISNSYAPRAVMTSLRPGEVNWAPIPPWDQTPLLAMQTVQSRLNRRYAIIGEEVDPEIKAARRQQLGNNCMSEMELVLEQIFQLQQQYESDQDIKMVAGGQPWQYSKQDIQDKHTITCTVDMKMLDLNYAEIKLENLAKLMPFQQAGGVVFQKAAEIVEPDLADELTQDRMSPTAMERERAEEYNAVSQILSGVEPIKPKMANHQFRLQTIQQILQDQYTAQKFGQDQIAQKRLENRMKFFQAQIQQSQINPQIGRAVSATTFGSQAPQISNVPA